MGQSWEEEVEIWRGRGGVEDFEGQGVGGG